ncbi:helix-turn-helix domain-containing protein [Pelagibius sp.]|uniref:helix-turn-helix domain-containing protein n=1 Tax=Pelagibius sp. TaxID=1931238 RepID=UPI003B50A38C
MAELTAVGKGGGTFGYLALIQLLASAATDDRVTGAQLRALNALARFAGPDGTCCVALSRLAASLGTKRQPIQRAVKALTSYGYLTSKVRWRKTGARGANLYTFYLALEGALACPVVWSQGLHLPNDSGDLTSQRVRGAHPLGGAHKKPSEDTSLKETSAFSQRAERCGIRLKASTQRRPTPVTNGGGSQNSVGAALRRRIADHNRETDRAASGRLWSEWSRLDPDLSLYDRLGAGAVKVVEKAQDIEAKKPGQGVRYLAGAVEQATGGSVTAADVLSGKWRRKRTR